MHVYVHVAASFSLLSQLNLKGLKNVDVDATQNARAIVQFLKSKLIQVKLDRWCMSTVHVQ